MRRSRTFRNLFLGNLLVMVLVIAVVAVLAYSRFDAKYRADMEQYQDQLAHAALEHFRDTWPQDANRIDAARVDRACKAMLGDPTARLTVVHADGTVLGDSEADPAHMVNHRTDDRPEIMTALSGQPRADIRYSDTMKMQYRYLALPLMRNDRVAAVVRLAVPVKAIAEGEALIRYAVIVSAGAAVAVAALLGLLTAWIWYAPLRDVTGVARQIASGDLSAKARFSDRGELAGLAKALNDMRDSLTGQVRLTEAKQQNLETVVANLREGIVATDGAGRVVLMNRAAGELFGADAQAALGQRLEGLAPVAEIIHFRNNALAGGKPTGGVVATDAPGGSRRTLDVQAAPIASATSDIRCVLVVRDVTELANAALMKTQFVANASHELRTPLATIRAAVDSLAAAETADAQTRAKCLDILHRQVGYLEDLTNDLLDLHRVETGRLPLRIEEIALGDLADWVRNEFAGPAKERGLDLSVQAAPAQESLHGDRKLLQLILRNLVDNAIKFTPSGGRAACAIEKTDLGTVLRVRDTGCGISPQDQPRVFERFFQSDAARTGGPSRPSGSSDNRTRGTGLGLAIVKHAAERLGAKVELQSELGRGTTVTVLLPPPPTEN